MIKNYNDFINNLLPAGFSMCVGNSDGIYATVPWGWLDEPPYETPVRWATGEPDTDPWEWRMRVLNERQDIAYGKFFFKKSGFITKEWYPYFLAVRRRGITFEEAYESGTISHVAKRVYDVICKNGTLPSHAIKQAAGFGKEEKPAFERGLVELQMKMFITICGSQQKISKKGDGHGLPASLFCKTEDFFKPADVPEELRLLVIPEDDVFEKAAGISVEEAIDKITVQVLKLNPQAEGKKILKFILG